MLSVPRTFLEPSNKMMESIKKHITLTAPLKNINKLSSKVAHAFDQVPRHLFVDAEKKACAYLNIPPLIGEGQTISQPFIVALMTELLDIQPTDKILEIGTGSGYQAAILSKLATEVHTMEIFSTLVKNAQACLRQLKCRNVHVHEGDGYQGWKKNAPYNKIVVTASAEQIPPPLISQLAINGIMIIPIGRQGAPQILTLIKKDKNSHLTQKAILEVSFVPFL
jgi:protein-L-isoaspartate(D-aspartate) O-methyltransferase